MLFAHFSVYIVLFIFDLQKLFINNYTNPYTILLVENYVFKLIVILFFHL